MAFSVRIGSALVTADTAAEVAELVRALGAASAEPVKRPQGTGSVIETPAGYQIRLRTGPGKRIHRGGFKSREEAEAALTKLVDTGVAPALKRHRRAPPPANDPIAAETVDEPAHAPIWPEWSGRAPTLGEGREDLPAPVPIAAPVVAPTLTRPAKRLLGSHRPKPGSISKRGDKFMLTVSVDCKAVFGGMYSTREEAETMQTRILDARLTGDPWPEIPRTIAQRVCRRCGEAGHDRRFCASAPLPPKEPREPKAPLGATATRRGTPEHTAKLADAMRASWVRRRAAVEQSAPVTTPEGALRNVMAGRLPWQPVAAPAPVRAKLPPRCHRCFRVGHVETDCPNLAGVATGAQTPADALSSAAPPAGKQRGSDEGAGASARPGQVPAPAPDELDDGGTDLTDLVDVPDAEPTVIPDLDLGTCNQCGRVGHWMGSDECPLASPLPPPPDQAESNRSIVRTGDVRVRGKSIAVPLHGHLRRAETEALVEYPDDVDRPATRGECDAMARPCPFVSCAHHLYLDINPQSGTIKVNFPHLEVWEMPETCSLDVADRGGITLEQVGAILNLTRERVRQVETKGLELAKKNARKMRMDFDTPVEPGSNAPEDSL